MAIDWSVDRDGTAFPVLDNNGCPKKPILLIIPGLSGGNNNLYTLSVLRKAQKQGYKCGTLIMRGCSELPLLTPKFYCIGSVTDIDEAVKFVHEKYIKDDRTGKNKQKFLAYGVSLGAMLFFSYLIRAGKKAAFDGVVMYGAGWHSIEDRDFFRKNFYGFYNYGLTQAQKPLYVKQLLPQIKQHFDCKTYNAIIEKCEKATEIEDYDKAIHLHLMGLKTLEDMHGLTVIRGNLAKIKVPTLHISADDDQIFEQLKKVPIDEACASTNTSVVLC